MNRSPSQMLHVRFHALCSFCSPLFQVWRTNDQQPVGSRHCSAQACLESSLAIAFVRAELRVQVTPTLILVAAFLSRSKIRSSLQQPKDGLRTCGVRCRTKSKQCLISQGLSPPTVSTLRKGTSNLFCPPAQPAHFISSRRAPSVHSLDSSAAKNHIRCWARMTQLTLP